MAYADYAENETFFSLSVIQELRYLDSSMPLYAQEEFWIRALFLFPEVKYIQVFKHSLLKEKYAIDENKIPAVEKRLERDSWFLALGRHFGVMAYLNTIDTVLSLPKKKTPAIKRNKTTNILAMRALNYHLMILAKEAKLEDDQKAIRIITRAISEKMLSDFDLQEVKYLVDSGRAVNLSLGKLKGIFRSKPSNERQFNLEESNRTEVAKAAKEKATINPILQQSVSEEIKNAPHEDEEQNR